MESSTSAYERIAAAKARLEALEKEKTAAKLEANVKKAEFEQTTAGKLLNKWKVIGGRLLE